MIAADVSKVQKRFSRRIERKRMSTLLPSHEDSGKSSFKPNREFLISPPTVVSNLSSFVSSGDRSKNNVFEVPFVVPSIDAVRPKRPYRLMA
jgi:hypothetical protein